MSHERELADHEVEHVAAELWMHGEGEVACVDDVRAKTRVENLDRVLGRLLERSLAERDGDGVRLTASGCELAERLVRRQRLAELLLSTVLDVGDDVVVHTACVMEHILGSAVTDSVCSFLGHPKFCPHGHPIPPGPCCRSFSNAIEPLVQPLSELAVGRSARIVYIAPKDPTRLARLANLGLAPGTTLRLQQKRPATILAVGETTLALDREIAGEIYVKKVS